MKLYVSIKGKGNFLSLDKGHLHIKCKTYFLRNRLTNQSQILSWEGGIKIDISGPGLMAKMIAMPI